MTIRCSSRADGDFHRTAIAPAELETRRRAFVDLPWTMSTQNHGTEVVRVTERGGGDGARGDIVITDLTDTVLGCWVADCAPLVLIGARREFAIVHGGWRGLAAGVVDVAAAAFSESITGAVLGPVIGPCCYEFGLDDLAAVADGVHVAVADITVRSSEGRVALDVPAAVGAACERIGVELTTIASCTGCSYDGFSHRVRADRERHVVAAWRPSEAAA